MSMLLPYILYINNEDLSFEYIQTASDLYE